MPSSKSGTTPPKDRAADRALVDAAFVCDLIKARELLAAGADPDARDTEDGRTPLFSAVLGGSLGLVGLLLEAGADINARDHQGFSALHFAAQEDLPEMARLLIAKGADVNALDEDGSSILWRAIFSSRNRPDMIQLLMAAGAKPDVANKAGESARDLATRLGIGAFTAN
ncbi:MAG: ankyrin repeat domain-containing protein [Deltaproteobacteria bacterium]|nr:ankyrin repeat domain-containing protein [Deltaproteobacteria bacterium]